MRFSKLIALMKAGTVGFSTCIAVTSRSLSVSQTAGRWREWLQCLTERGGHFEVLAGEAVRFFAAAVAQEADANRADFEIKFDEREGIPPSFSSSPAFTGRCRGTPPVKVCVVRDDRAGLAGQPRISAARVDAPALPMLNMNRLFKVGLFESGIIMALSVL